LNITQRLGKKTIYGWTQVSEERIGNQVVRTKSVTQWKSNQCRGLSLIESHPKFNLHKLMDMRVFWFIIIFYLWANLVTIRTLNEIPAG